MEVVEALKIALLFIIAYEGAFILKKHETLKKPDEPRSNRRDVYGVYRNPLGDSYRKNSKNLYVPIKPGTKMIESSEDDEE